MSVIELCNTIQRIEAERMKWERKLDYIRYMTQQETMGEVVDQINRKITSAKEEEARILWTIQMSPTTIHEIVVTVSRQCDEIKKIGERVDELEHRLHELHS